jgi:hypothetical protein
VPNPVYCQLCVLVPDDPCSCNSPTAVRTGKKEIPGRSWNRNGDGHRRRRRSPEIDSFMKRFTSSDRTDTTLKRRQSQCSNALTPPPLHLHKAMIVQACREGLSRHRSVRPAVLQRRAGRPDACRILQNIAAMHVGR